ncbi:1952_t:CDS:1, partial [Cetraspora pellucida]
YSPNFITVYTEVNVQNQISGKTKTINFATSNRYQDPISISQGLKEETIIEMVHQFLQNEFSIRDIRAEAYALVLLALNANTSSSQLSQLRRELRNLDASSQIIKATKFPDITKNANKIQKN